MSSASETAAFDARIRLFVYRHFVDARRAPTRAEVARHIGASRDQVNVAFSASTWSRQTTLAIERSRFAGVLATAHFDERVKVNRLRADEPALVVGVDLARRLRRRPAATQLHLLARPAAGHVS